MSLDLTQATFAERGGRDGYRMSADHVTLERGLWWGTAGTPGRTFVLADLLNPGQRVHLHQCIWDADHVHHVHDALKARTHAEVTQERPPPRAGSTRDTTGCARHAPGRSAPCRWAAGPSASQNNPEASSGRYPSPLASCSQPPLMNGAHSRSEQRPGGGAGAAHLPSGFHARAQRPS